MRILVTGGAGFIGSNFVHYMVKNHPEHHIVVLDKLTYAGRKENLDGVMDKITFIHGDICDKQDVDNAVKGCDLIINFAAESHVDKSITDAGSFVNTNVYGTYNLLEAARKYKTPKFLQISTDEVYGQILEGSSKETDILDPRNPYSATKAGAEFLCKSYYVTYGVPVVITRSSNNYGPRQYPEKMIPLFILNSMHDKPLTLYKDGKQIRDWLYVEDNCEAIFTVAQHGNLGEIYNIGAGNEDEVNNFGVAKEILRQTGKSESLIKFVEDRPGHDFRYSLSFDRIRSLGWKPKTSFEEGLKKTIEWYVHNESWWRSLVQKSKTHDIHG